MKSDTDATLPTPTKDGAPSFIDARDVANALLEKLAALNLTLGQCPHCGGLLPSAARDALAGGSE